MELYNTSIELAQILLYCNLKQAVSNHFRLRSGSLFGANISRRRSHVRKSNVMNRLISVLRSLCFALCALFFTSSACLATTYYVAPYGSDSNPGTQAKPFLTLTQAVSSTVRNDTVLVADGTYTGAGNRNMDFRGVDITVKSVSGSPANCIIDCQKLGCAFILKSGETKNSRIAGFTIENGTGFSVNSLTSGGGIYISNNNPTVNNCAFTNNSAAADGGGMSGGAATNCAFTGNSVSYGGGGGMSGGAATNCTFASNAATYNGGGMYFGTATNCAFNGNKAGHGGGMYFGAATNCTFASNTETNVGGGMYGGTATNCVFTGNSASSIYGGGGGMSGGAATNCIFTGNSADNGGGMSDGTAANCAFTGNSANSYGGGMSGGTATNCAFTGNLANSYGGSGGGMYSGRAINCIFTGNSASSVYSYGGGMHGGTATNCAFTGNKAGFGGGTYGASLYFCTIVNNATTGNGGGAYLSNNTVTNCILWGNTAMMSGAAIYDDGTSKPGAVSYSDAQGGSLTNGNISADPLFVNGASGNLHLTSASPCINAGATTVSSGFALPITDLDGGSRTVGAGPDMGAYEYGGSVIVGAILFSGIAANAPPQIVSFQFRPVGGTPINQTYYTTSDGAFYLNSIPDGSYNLWVKSPTYLAALVTVTVSGGTVSGITATLQPGDANNDNSCDSTDFGILIGAFNTQASMPGSGYDATADFNGDGFVDSTDFGLLIGSFNMQGNP